MSRTELHTADIADTGDAYTNVTGSSIASKRALDVSSMGADGVTDVLGNPIVWDTIAYAEPDTVTETYTYSLAAADLVIYTVTYTDSGKETLAATAVVKSAP